MYEIVLTSAFKRKLKIIKKQNKRLYKLTEVVNKLANNEKLGVKNHDHQLITNLKFNDYRECHIEPDWLLIYKKDDNNLILYLIDTGSHSDLF